MQGYLLRKNLSPLLHHSDWTHGISKFTGKCLKNVKQSAISNWNRFPVQLRHNFYDFSILANWFQQVQITSKGNIVNKTWQTYFKQDDKIVSIGTLIVRFLYNTTNIFRVFHIFPTYLSNKIWEKRKILAILWGQRTITSLLITFKICAFC